MSFMPVKTSRRFRETITDRLGFLGACGGSIASQSPGLGPWSRVPGSSSRLSSNLKALGWSRTNRTAKVDPQVQQEARTGLWRECATSGRRPAQLPSRIKNSQPPVASARRRLRHSRGPAARDSARYRSRPLGDSHRIQEIAKLNQDLLADGRISAGMRLLLPPDARPAAPRGK